MREFFMIFIDRPNQEKKFCQIFETREAAEKWIDWQEYSKYFVIKKVCIDFNAN
jgi:hypothetical protein